jgi:hypothetical protein
MRRTIGLLVAGMVAMSVFATAGTAAAQVNPATVHVLHGVPGATVEVCVNGAEVKSRFNYKNRFTAELPAGEYRVVIRASAPGECEGDRIRGANVDLMAGRNYTLAAGLGRGGGVRLFAFQNNVRDLGAGQARAQVRHIAAAPPVDVWMNGTPAIRGFAPGGSEATVTLPRGDYTVRVAPAGTTTTVIGPRTFSLNAGVAYQIFASGNGSAGYTFLVLAQKV